ncbi:MAG: SOS response-associated peptidase [Symbiobacteriaceae bacterium]|nr:SOS response-associated peptidase [Symbiobacteriaceae bacterium]
MCGRYILFSQEDIAEITALLKEIEERNRIQEVRPTDLAPVLVAAPEGDNGYQVTLMRWGFPQYGKAGVVINARSETAANKAMFKNSLRERRCIVPSSGYLEWSGPAKSKVQHYITQPQPSPLYMAGCYNSFRNKEGELEQRFVIFTTPANSSVAAIHNRMPVILLPEELDNWLYHPQYPNIWQREHVQLQYSNDGQLELFSCSD